MFSFGIEYDLAFSIAFASARFPAGSGPPSRAATISARESLEKSFPRFASAAPFLCLIELHLLCPDIRLLPLSLEVGLEARHLPPVRVPGDLEVQDAEVTPVEQDHPCAGAEDRTREAADRLL